MNLPNRWCSKCGVRRLSRADVTGVCLFCAEGDSVKSAPRREITVDNTDRCCEPGCAKTRMTGRRVCRDHYNQDQNVRWHRKAGEKAIYRP